MNTDAGFVNGAVGYVDSLPDDSEINPIVAVRFQHISQISLLNNTGYIQIPMVEQEFL